ncbi:hypothetical protein [Thiolapillus sp.]
MKELSLLPLILLAGCCSFSEQQLPLFSVQMEPVPVCQNLLADYEAYSSMDDRARAIFRKDMDQQRMLTGDRCEQLRLALVYSQGDVAQKARALKLVEDLLASGAMAELLSAQRIAQLLRDRLTDERKQLLRVTQLRYELKRQQADNRRQAEELENLRSRLRQLKQIEQNINEKEQSLIPPAANELPSGAVPDPGG